MRRTAAVFSVAFLIISLAACRNENIEPETGYAGKPVKVVELKEETAPKFIEYFGIIGPEEVKNIGFKNPGRIAAIHVEKGDDVKKGTVLAMLDTQEIEYALKASKAQLDAAHAQIAAAEDAFSFAKNSYARSESLFLKGALSKQAYEEAKLTMDIRASELERAKEAGKQAEADYQRSLELMEDSVIKADMDGYVVDVLYKEGEIVAAGYPVIVVRNRTQVVNVGIAQKDMGTLTVGAKAEVEVGGTVTEGSVKSISQVPDSRTMTYNTEIALKDGNFPIGSTARVKIAAGESAGIWIPVSCIMSDGEDYVFIADGDMAVKRKITIKQMQASRVMVDGLNTGEKLVVEGAKRLKEMDRLIIQD